MVSLHHYIKATKMAKYDTKIGDYLLNNGSCWRCNLIIQGFTNIEDFQDDNEEKFTGPRETKKVKFSQCCSCLGILQSKEIFSQIEQISSTILAEKYDSCEFSLALSLPVSLGLRIHSLWVHLLNAFPEYPVTNARNNHIGVLKDIWRNIVGAKIEKFISKEFITGKIIDFVVSVQTLYPDDEKECLQLEKINSAKFSIRRQQHRKYNEGVFTRQVVIDTLEAINDLNFLTLLPEFPSEPTNSLQYQTTSLHSSIYLAGRYNKFSRELPQTPWMIEGDRRFDTSLQELISESLEKFIRSQSIKFSASGREDVDVRCLGNGRPFVIEFINPRRTKVSMADLLILQKEINATNDRIAIKDLQLIKKAELSNLKEGEEEKTKSYCALCISAKPLKREEVEEKLSLENLVLDQKTPIRVLHRRSLATRQRTIHKIRSQYIDENHFKIYLKTQAGTYIKEFVHGDFGRTTPNLDILLSAKCDIVALDVENVQLDWPPSLSREEINDTE